MLRFEDSDLATINKRIIIAWCTVLMLHVDGVK
jgi:hypothetical protein